MSQERFESTSGLYVLLMMSSVLMVYDVIKNKNSTAAFGNIYAHVAPVNRGLHWAYFMYKTV